MIKMIKKQIGFFVLLVYILFSFLALNVNPIYATSKSNTEAEQESKRQVNESKTKKNTTKKSSNKDVLVTSDDGVESETVESVGKRKTIGGPAGEHRLEEQYAGKSRVLVPTGGGGMGEGGGAAKNIGGTAGKSIDFSNDAKLNQEVVSNTVSDSDGKDLISETMGFAKDDGQFYKENEGNNAGTKIFELDRNGSIGFDEDHISVANIKGFMSFFLFAAFGLGGLSFFMATRDVRSKNNYF